mgnify:CR=1 FL=1
MNESLRQQILKRDGHRCQICGRGKPDGTPIEVHHYDPKGMGGDPSKDVPENLITLCGEHHRLIHDGLWRILHWNPNDPEDGLVVIDAQSRKVPKEELWFYRQCLEEDIGDTVGMLRQYIEAVQEAEWEMAHHLFDLKAQKAHRILGYSSFAELVASEIGIRPGWAIKAARTVEVLRQYDDLNYYSAPIARAAKIASMIKRGKLGKEEAQEWLIKAATLGPVDWRKEWRERFGDKKLQKFLVLKDPRAAELVEAMDEEEIQGDVVVRVAALIRGREKIQRKEG